MQRNITVIILGTIITVIFYFCVPLAIKSTYQSLNSPKILNKVDVNSKPLNGIVLGDVTIKEKVEESQVIVTHISPPETIKGIYMSQCVVGTPNFREKLVTLIKDTELNAVVIDIKDSNGKLSFRTDNPILKNSVSGSCGANDMKLFLSYLHTNNIYVIGRITTFQDLWYTKIHPELAVKTKSGEVWKDSKGQSFIDAGAKEFWGYIVEIGKESYKVGFDELNFDYIRFPSDGNMEDTEFTFDVGRKKSEVIKEFFSYLHDNLKKDGIVISADLFGMTTTATNDMGIGQVFVDALPYFDYIDPMVYPSHFGSGWGGFKNPAEHPYEIIKITMNEAIARAKSINQNPNKVRPWLQDFSLGAVYTADLVRDQIRATNESGLNSWLFWSAANTYTKEAFVKESNQP